ncbi:MAG: hypothetical protein COT39_01545 [Parcubacteria group bacterium CG08_land_8_20_14_0_20_48_21]|nr:MAG: hypothetical protein COT39_01545 [Parcubacteria group bacterium CG08_land_8_20_14_0_20_48_21]PIW79552.1 MAG: hypothetical protein COZ99_00430 [Parcubacteria group bacterium CG_4_8_14_3_um_filter_48_16]PIY77635.1 MAG: hypothetical protein COY83_04190 [Parcubacteria group bacterium CG_4_10_14_0_8_um_filter_48_154]PIZ77247.1 MAG: hypothetical protein COY03_03505 [bacterium CG_4_10_14_0_2_um_filter_48_144]PJC39908.1 MAG: hypothetical protein CO043_01720 [Parcubacteria group bacterium CG_4_9
MISIAILASGTSSERDIAIQSAGEVQKYLDTKKYKVTFFDFPNDLQKFLEHYKTFDIALPIFHGSCGKDGTVQGFLETLGIHYTFSGVATHALAIDKHRTKVLCAAAGMSVPRGV